ncbi:unnamed protein product, partial [Hapterophycus canaliculatus]
MPATLERLGGTGGGEHPQHQPHVAGTGGVANGGRNGMNGNGNGTASGCSSATNGGIPVRQHRPNRMRSFSSGSSTGGDPQQRQYQQPGLSLGKPGPLVLSEGALATPAEHVMKETFLERGRRKVEAPWLDDDVGGPGGGGGGIRLDEELDEDDRPEAAERRRVEAAAELQRQKEQEEWDRAFEEELMQTGLPEDVVAACVYQIL